MRARLAGLAGIALVVAGIAAVPAGAADSFCPDPSALRVPGAQMQQAACLNDLSASTLALSGYSDRSDWQTLSSASSKNPPAGAGIQIDGYFPDDSTTNTTRGWNHDSQFVIRLPENWNGGLVVTGAPGVRKQYATDYLISDWVLAQGYAYAATDKGNTGNSFFNNGSRSEPGQAVLEWHERVAELTRAAKQVVAQRYGRPPARTYMTGISNGGYLTRWQLERYPQLYDGGVDWEGTLFTPDGPNLFTYLPTALKNYPRYAATGDKAAHDAMIAAGFAPGSEPLWDYHYGVYWDLTQRVYREEFDPTYDGATSAGYPFCPGGVNFPGCDADYVYADRPQAVKDAVASVSLTGRIGKPMLTLHGDLDALLPIATDSDVYTRMIADAGRGALSRYYVIGGGTHVDSLYDEYPSLLRPILPCYREAFLDLTRWVEKGAPPPPSQTVPKPAGGDVANTCPQLAAASTAQPVAGAGTPGTAPGTAPGSAPAGGTRATAGRAAGSGPAARTLATTGASPLLPAAGVALLVAAGAARRRGRREPAA